MLLRVGGLRGSASPGLPWPAWLSGSLLSKGTQFENAAWTQTALASLTANVAPSLYAGVSYDRMIENTANTTHHVTQSYVFAATQQYVLRAIVKPVGTRNLSLFLPATPFTTAPHGRFTLTGGGSAAAVANCTVDISQLSDSSYLCTVTATSTVGGNGSATVRIVSGTTTSYAGDGTSGLDVAAVGLALA